MQYFNTLPKIIKTDAAGKSVILTNLLARSSIIPSLLKNANLYYQYDIQDGDTPESIAYKYYGESYRYWIVLFANQIIDPQWQWPMSYLVFQAYLNDKYPTTNIYGTVQEYQQITTTVDSVTSTTTIETIAIDQATYTSFIPTTKTLSFPDGSSVIITITTNALSIYDYELNANEANRKIKIFNKRYVEEIENEFESLMKS